MHSPLTYENKKSYQQPYQQDDSQTSNSIAGRLRPSAKRPVGSGKEPTDLSVRKAVTLDIREKPSGDGLATIERAHSLAALKIPSNPSPSSATSTPRPFSPSALASRSGKTIKAFFRNRRDDAESPGSLEAHIGLHGSSNPTAGMSRTQTKQDIVGLPSISVKVSPDHGPPVNPAFRNSRTDHCRTSLKTSEVKVQFPKVSGHAVSRENTDGDNMSKRKPRRSLSFFRTALRSQQVAKLTPPQLAEPLLDNRRLPRQRPMSAPMPGRLSASCTDRSSQTSRINKPDSSDALLDSRLHKDSSNGVVRSGESRSPQPGLSLSTSNVPKTRHTSTSAKGLVGPAAEELDPKPPDRLYTEGLLTMKSVPLTSALSATTSLTTEVTSDPDREAHYMLRMACTYLTKTVLPEVTAARKSDISLSESHQPPASMMAQQESRTPSEKADALRNHVYGKIKLMVRMERAWGIDWMLRGKDEFAISDARKEKERDLFRRSVDDGVLLCFLLLRLKHTKPTGGRGIILSSAAATKSNLALASEMANSLPLTGDDVGLLSSIHNPSGTGIYASARLIIALARLAGPHKPVVGKDGPDMSNPTSDDEEAAAVDKAVSHPSQVTLAFQRPIYRPPLLVRRLSSKSSTSGASTPKQLEAIHLPSLQPPSTDPAEPKTIHRLTSHLRDGEDTISPASLVSNAPRLTTPVQVGGASPPQFRRPILRVKQSFASSVTSGNTSTADSRSRTSAWYPRFIPENTAEIPPAENASIHCRSDVPSLNSPTRTVSFGLSDEHAQQQVKTFRSQTRYRVRGAKPKFSQESLSANEIAIADEEDEPYPSGQAVEGPVLPSTPKRNQNAQIRVNTPQRTTSPIQMRYARPSSGVSITPMSPIAFPGTPPRTPRKQSGVLPLSLAGSRRTSFASSNGDSTSNRYSKQTIEVVVNGQRKANYQLGNSIGKGQFGIVHKALDLASGQFVAIKRIGIKGTKGDEVGQIMREVDLLQRLKHPSIVQYLGMARNEESLDIVLEFIEGGSLAHSVRSFGPLNEELVAGYVGKILEGLNYLHGQDVVHCDLKGANILTTKTGNVKLSDFGVSLNLRAVGHFKEDVVGSPNWMAPEVIELKGITTAADIWSLGATVIELVTGKPPYHDMDNGMAVMYRIVDEAMEIPDHCSPGLAKFLEQCFRKNPKDRPTAEELFEHEWVKSRINLGPDLRHHDSIPFLRRISTDAFKLHAERMIVDDSPLPRAQQHTPMTPDVSGGLAASAVHRSSLPIFAAYAPMQELDSPTPAAVGKELDSGQATETARARQRTLDKLNATSSLPQVPSSVSSKPEGRSRLFSLSSLSGRRKASGAHGPEETDTKREDLGDLAPEGVSAALPESSSTPGASSWLSASALKSGFLYNGYDSNKGCRDDVKSDCRIM